MKQLLQSADTGEPRVEDVPARQVGPGFVLVRNAASLVSAGTERKTVEFSKKSLLQKARARPDLVKKVVAKARADGPRSAWEAARSRLRQPLALGYSAAGRVLEVGDGVEGVRAGDQVACAGAGYASHAEIISVPRNLVTPLPDGVSLEAAAFTTVGAVGLQGIRLADVQLGESVAVVGLGLIGLLTVQMARAAGCRVIGIDVDASRVALARDLGVDVAIESGADREDPISAAMTFSGGRGVDAVLLTAATSSNEPVELAGEICRDRGRVVVVGAVGLRVPRPTYYGKELSFRISRSYGPGRYDPLYEEGGVDYPVGFVRWTENRNMEAFLEMLARGTVQVDPLVTHRIPIDRGEEAYELLTGRAGPSLGILVTYPQGPVEGSDWLRSIQLRPIEPRSDGADAMGVGFLGAGNFAVGTLIPALKSAAPGGRIELVSICSATGPSAHHAASRFGFGLATTEESAIVEAPNIDLVAIATRHNLHARQVAQALGAGKHVFCEKPLCLNQVELADLVSPALEAADAGRLLLVGYNRRFAPMASRLADFLSRSIGPLMAHYRVNAGHIPAEHWVHDPEVGGGRIVGEACHFIDFLSFLTDSLPVRVHATGPPDRGFFRGDNITMTLDFQDGSVGTVTYVASGDRGLGKERCEVFCGSTSAVLEDFRTLALYEGGKRTVVRERLRQDKGHRGEWEALLGVLASGGTPPISFESLVATSLATFGALDSLKTGEPVGIDAGAFIDAHAAKDGA